jgi:hypothetical protein
MIILRHIIISIGINLTNANKFAEIRNKKEEIRVEVRLYSSCHTEVNERSECIERIWLKV